MQSVEMMYLNPNEDMKEFLLQQGSELLASEVRYKVTYMSKDLISVVFEDLYFMGSVYSQYQDLRTVTINLKDGKLYEIKDIVKLNDEFMSAWLKSMKKEAPEERVVDLISLEDYKKVFEGEHVDNRYYNAFFLKDGGLEIGLSFHYGDGDLLSRGWMTAPFTNEEIAPYKTDSGLWKIVESNN